MSMLFTSPNSEYPPTFEINLWKKFLHCHVHCGNIYKRQVRRSTWWLTDEWTDKWNVMCTHWNINQPCREENATLCYSMSRSEAIILIRGQHKKTNIVSSHLYVECEQSNYQKQKADEWERRLGVLVKMGTVTQGCTFQAGRMCEFV